MESYSQCGQDLFVINILKNKVGKFLDLGSYSGLTSILFSQYNR